MDDPERRTQFAVLDLLLAAYPGPRSQEELVRAVGENVEVADALSTLTTTGLVYCAGRLYWATEAAVTFARVYELLG